jgi:hypothetical protein
MVRVFWKASKGSNADGLPPALLVPLKQSALPPQTEGKLAPIGEMLRNLNLNFAQIMLKKN